MIEPVVVVVTSLQGVDDMALVSLEQPSQSRPAKLGCTGTEEAFVALGTPGALPDKTVRAAGMLLYQGLSANDEVKSALDTALQVEPDKRRPLILELRQVDARIEALPWETLYAEGAGFLGLDSRWSIGRRVHSNQGQPASELATPLRIAAVLSCLGNPAADEWEQLKAAVDAAVADDRLSIEVLLFASEPDLLQTIRTDPPDWLWDLEGIPKSATDLAATFQRHRARGFVPHVLHFFCHGSTQLGPHLEIAVPTDWDDPVQSSLTLEPSDINQLSAPTARPWLVVLNCCLGAAGADGDTAASSQPLAMSLVKDGGYPAVIGMRQSVDVADATTFSSCFYPELFGVLAAQQPAEPVPPDWSRLLITARRKLAEDPPTLRAEAAERRPQWTLPVLYVRYRQGSADFQVTREKPVVAPAPPARDPGTATGGPPTEPGVPGGPGGAEPAPAANDPLATLLHDLLAVSGPDAPNAWPADLQARLDALRGGQR